ncbi:hypothetical protein ACVWWJ_003364 [Luteibacter sp. HA06]
MTYRNEPGASVTLSIVICALLVSAAPVSYGADVKDVDIKLNPAPRIRRGLTVTVQNAPGVFDHVDGTVDYKVVNRDCVPLAPAIGATLVPEKRIAIELTPTARNSYRASLVADLVQDEDYFGLGVCRWAVVGANANFSHDIVSFSAAIFNNNVMKNGTVTKYFSDDSYTDIDMKRVDIGEESPARYKDRVHTFSISITSGTPHQ